MTDVAKKVQDYKDSLKQKAEHLIIKGFPEKIVKLNELLETSNFQNRDLADVHQDLNIPVPPPASASNEPNAKRPRVDSSEVSSNSSVNEGTRVYALPNGTVPCNKPLSDLIHLVKPHIRELVEDSNLPNGTQSRSTSAQTLRMSPRQSPIETTPYDATPASNDKTFLSLRSSQIG
ncbi:unnamed protein product [Spodoptera exigua]|nr:unnamed protein product [Spodoptera exigua]